MARPSARIARVVVAAAIVAAAWVSATLPARAQPPSITIDGSGVRIEAVSATVADLLEALGRAAQFEVRFDGPRPSTTLYQVSIQAASPLQAFMKVIEGQNLNYGLTLDPNNSRVRSVMMMGSPPKAGGAATAPTPTPAPGRPQILVPRPPRGVPINEDAPEETAEPPQEPEPTPSPTPSPTGFRPGGPYPPLARPPFGSPFGPRPQPSPSPSP